MKEQQQLKSTQLIENVKQVKVDVNKFLGRINPHTGHTLFEFNKVNYQLQAAKFEVQSYNWNQEQEVKKVIVKEHCFYLSALNVKSAMKKINRLFNPDFIAVLND